MIDVIAKNPHSDSLDCSLYQNPLPIQDTLTEKDSLAVFMGMVYYLSNPLFELNDYTQFNEWLKNASEDTNLVDIFSSNGRMIATFRNVENRMVESGIRSYRPQDQNWAYERALEMGANIDQARKISIEVNQGSLDMVLYGEELIWLADVLPEYVRGNFTPFEATGTITRQAVRVIRSYYKFLGEEYAME